MRNYMMVGILCATILLSAQGCTKRAIVQPMQMETGMEGDILFMNVKIIKGTFSPETLRVQEGTRVRWTNYDLKFHTVTSMKGRFDSGDLPHGGMFSHVFEEKGVYDYMCEFYPYMKGRVIVE